MNEQDKNITCGSTETEDFEETILIPLSEYRQLVSKCAALEILSASIRKTGKINNDIVRAVTGSLEDETKKECDIYWGYYVNEKKKTDEQAKIISQLETANNELREILRQNGIGLYKEDSGE